MKKSLKKILKKLYSLSNIHLSFMPHHDLALLGNHDAFIVDCEAFMVPPGMDGISLHLKKCQSLPPKSWNKLVKLILSRIVNMHDPNVIFTCSNGLQISPAICALISTFTISSSFNDIIESFTGTFPCSITVKSIKEYLKCLK